MQTPLRDSHHIGSDTAELIPSAAARAALGARGIALVGLSDAGRGYHMYRPRFDAAHVLFTLGGAGRVWVDGEWVESVEGTAYVSPAHVASAFETLPGRRWRFAWIFLDPAGLPPLGPFAAGRSTLVQADGNLLAAAVDGLYRESIGPAAADLLDHWAHLVHAYCRRAIHPSPSRQPDPLAWLWAEVDARPAADWSVARLSEIAGVSRETVRRLCLAHHGRSPMEHVTHVRLRRADTLLQSTSVKIAAIARMAGYENEFAFSTAFRRVHGVPPSARRPRGR